MMTIIGGAFAFALFGVGAMALAAAASEARGLYRRIKNGC